MASNDESMHALDAKSNEETKMKRKNSCKRKILNLVKNKLFILNWITKYNGSDAISDLIAGITLGLTMIPQSIAYATLAGVPSQYGLYAAFAGSIVYVFFGTVKEVSIGPTSLMSLLTLQYTMDKPVELVIILAFIAGVVEFLMGVFKLGFLVDFISVPVTSAFTSATSLIIIGAQLKQLLGISFSSKGFLATFFGVVNRIFDVHAGDAFMGFLCITVLLLLRKIADIPVSKTNKYEPLIKKCFWYIGISRNALVVLLSSVVAYNWSDEIPFKLSGKVESGIPKFEIPQFNMEYNNQTLGAVEILQDLGSGIILVPLVAVLANVAIAKSFSSGKVVDASQEMIALGLCNLIGSCFKSMPTCGAFTRSAVSHASGVRTPMAGIYSGIMTVLALTLLTPYFYFIPKATLAAVLICAVLFMMDFVIVKKLWTDNKSDFLAWLGCFFVCIFLGVEVGLLFGIFLSLLHLLYMWARPDVTVQIVEIENARYLRIIPRLGMFFPGVDFLRQKVNKASIKSSDIMTVVVDCEKFNGLDYTSAKGIVELSKDLNLRSQLLILLNLDTKLQWFIQNTENIAFCNIEEDLLQQFLCQDIEENQGELLRGIRKL